MLCWFLGAGAVAVWNVFHDPTLDHRLLALGLLLPDLIDGPQGGVRFMHSISANVALLLACVLLTIGRRPLRKRLLAVSIGSFVHLVLDGAFNNTRAFWWPLTGLSLPSGRLPSLDRSFVLDALLEVLGLAGLVWMWRRFELSDPAARRQFLTSGTFRGTRSADAATC